MERLWAFPLVRSTTTQLIEEPSDLRGGVPRFLRLVYRDGEPYLRCTFKNVSSFHAIRSGILSLPLLYVFALSVSSLYKLRDYIAAISLVNIFAILLMPVSDLYLVLWSWHLCDTAGGTSSCPHPVSEIHQIDLLFADIWYQDVENTTYDTRMPSRLTHRRIRSKTARIAFTKYFTSPSSAKVRSQSGS